MKNNVKVLLIALTGCFLAGCTWYEPTPVVVAPRHVVVTPTPVVVAPVPPPKPVPAVIIKNKPHRPAKPVIINKNKPHKPANNPSAVYKPSGKTTVTGISRPENTVKRPSDYKGNGSASNQSNTNSSVFKATRPADNNSIPTRRK